MLSWPHCTQLLARANSPSSQIWLRSARSRVAAHQQPVAGQHGDQNAPCQLQTEGERNGEDGEQADEQVGKRHVARLQLLIRAEAVQADEGEEHHHRHQVTERQLHAFASEMDEVGEGDERGEGEQAEDPGLKQFIELGGGQGQPVHHRPGGQAHHQQTGEQPKTHRHKAHAGQGKIFGWARALQNSDSFSIQSLQIATEGSFYAVRPQNPMQPAPFPGERRHTNRRIIIATRKRFNPSKNKPVATRISAGQPALNH